MEEEVKVEETVETPEEVEAVAEVVDTPVEETPAE